MCDFCEALNKSNKIIWNVRSHMADDNVCEYINDLDCSQCKNCNESFSLSAHQYEDNTYVGVDYEKIIADGKGEEVKIMPFSETIQFNYCPICGKQISKTIKDWDEYYSHQIYIEEE